MRNQEAARYARWAASVAGLIALVVVGFYVVRAFRAARQHASRAQVSTSVQQQMQTFAYNGMEGNRTVFTIRASRATEFKTGNPALLEDVWISIYGAQGDRNDSIHTRECSYAQKTGGVQCKGEVTIDVRPAKAAARAPGQQSLHITTSNLTFDGQTGEAESPAPVEFTLPQGHGSGLGVIYRTRAAVVRIEHAVKFEMAPTPRTGGVPVQVQASSLEVQRNQRKVLLAGPVVVQQGGRELSAGQVSVSLGEKFHAREVLAEGNPSIRVSHGGDVLRASATRLQAELSPEGWIEHLTASGRVFGSRQSPKGSSRFSSDRVDFSMAPARNVLREMTATGAVVAQAQQAGVSELLKAPALRVSFGAGRGADRQHIQQAETLGPSTILLKDKREATALSAPQFTAQFTRAGRLQRLVGATGVEVRRTAPHAATQISTARVLNASFASDGQWSAVEEKGDVRFEQGERRATAQDATIDRSSGKILLTGSPVISDSLSRTSASSVTLSQKSTEFAAEGGVVTTYFPAKSSKAGAKNSRAEAMKSGTEPVHISAQKVMGSTASGRVVYLGDARLWQGRSVLQAEQIAISRDQNMLQATGNVAAAFPQVSGPSLLPASEAGKSGSGPTLWQARAQQLTYVGQRGKLHLAGGVTIASGQLSLTAQTLDIDLSESHASTSPAQPAPLGGQLERAVARGQVTLRQGDLRATADTGTYTPADGKFILSGGKPTITDGSGNSAAGRSLTFLLPNGTILIDSQEGSRTLTRYRVEK